MQTKLTKSQIYDNFNKVLSVPYCDAQHLLDYAKIACKIGYGCGVYGWNWDAYEITIKSRKYCIVTGYRPFGTQCNYKLLRKYEDKARRKVNENWHRQDTSILLKNYILKESQTWKSGKN